VGLLGHLMITTAGVSSASISSIVIESWPLSCAEASSVTLEMEVLSSFHELVGIS
jgi:hypothetical protein